MYYFIYAFLSHLTIALFLQTMLHACVQTRIYNDVGYGNQRGKNPAVSPVYIMRKQLKQLDLRQNADCHNTPDKQHAISRYLRAIKRTLIILVQGINAVFGKIARIASEEIVLQLVDCKGFSNCLTQMKLQGNEISTK